MPSASFRPCFFLGYPPKSSPLEGALNYSQLVARKEPAPTPRGRCHPGVSGPALGQRSGLPCPVQVGGQMRKGLLYKTFSASNGRVLLKFPSEFSLSKDMVI